MHMMLALVVPELMVGFALADLLAARASERDMRKWAEQDVADWSLTHAFFANLGGFVLRLRIRQSSIMKETMPDTISKRMELSLNQTQLLSRRQLPINLPSMEELRNLLSVTWSGKRCPRT